MMTQPSLLKFILATSILSVWACADESNSGVQTFGGQDMGSFVPMDAAPPPLPLDAEPMEEMGPPPVLFVDEPLSGTFVSRNAGSIRVAGRVENASEGDQVTISGQPIALGLDGSFSHPVMTTAGIQHIDVLYARPPDTILKVRRSVLVGADTPWDVASSAAVGAHINPSTLERISDALEGPTARQLIQESILDSAGEGEGDDDDDLEIHEVDYENLDVNMTFQDGLILAQMSIVNFAVRLTYNYEVIGIGGQVSGWVRAENMRITAEIRLIRDNDGTYNLEVANPQVELENLDLELDSFYEAFESIAEPLVEDLARQAILDVLSEYVTDDLLDAELLSQEIDLFGQTMTMDIRLNQMSITPEGLTADAGATIGGVPPIKEAPGIWQVGAGSYPETASHDLAVNVGLDALNQFMAHAWRGGIMDGEFRGDDPDSVTASLTMAALGAVANPDLLESFPAQNAITLSTEALLQPTVHLAQDGSAQVEVDLGAFRMHISAPNTGGNLVKWAVLEFSGQIRVTSDIEGGRFRLSGTIDTHFEVVEEPFMPLNRRAFEDFIQSIVAGISQGALDDAINEVIEFDNIDVLGLVVEQAHMLRVPGAPGFLQIALELGVAPVMPEADAPPNPPMP